jgi:RND family efflux transporter MFP subunit
MVRVVYTALLAVSLMLCFGHGPVWARSSEKPVVVAEAAMRLLAPVDYYTGTIISREQAKLAAEVSGRLLWVAEVGDSVEAGGVVARIDDELLREELIEREADVARIQARLQFLKLEAARLQELARSNNAAQSQLEQVESDRLAAKSELKAAQARARRSAALLERTQLRAPFPGVVTERLLYAGEWADEGAAVVAMTDPLRLEIQGWVSVSALPFLEQQMPVSFEYHGEVFEGRVRTLVPVGDIRSRLYELRVSLPEGSWKVGESVRIAVPAAIRREVLSVPRDALVLRRDAISVFVVDSDSVAHRVVVIPGIASGPWIEVRGDLKPGDRVVTRGSERLRDGQKVVVQGQGGTQ